MIEEPRPMAASWWRGVPPLHREMCYVGGALFLVGSFIIVVDLLLPGADYDNLMIIGGLAFVAVLAGLFYLWSADRLPLPRWSYVLGITSGSLLVTVLVQAGGPQRTAVFAVLYVFVSTYAFFYHARLVAVGIAVLNAVGFALVLASLQPPGAVAQWVILMGTAVVAGGLTGSLSQRVRRLLDAERRTVAALHELDAWKDTFLQTVTHDLRSPLTSMLGMLETVRDHDLPAEQQAQFIDRAVAAGQRLERLVGDLLDVQQIEAGVRGDAGEEVELRQLLEQTLAEIELDGRTLVRELEPVTAVVEVVGVQRIVTNLVHNALVHTAPDVTVWVRLAAEGDVAVLVVEDDGQGIAPEVRDGLFDAFRRSGSSTTGVGLGLYLVRRFTELHGGEVSAADRDGGGARFEVRLPRRSASPSSATLAAG